MSSSLSTSSSSSAAEGERAPRAAKRAATPPPQQPPQQQQPRAPRFRGPAANTQLGETFLDAISIVCAHGHGLDLFHARYVCGETFREGVRRADGSLDRAGFLGATADMIRCATRIHAPWLAEARAARREGNVAFSTSQLLRAARDGDERRVRELVAAGAPLNLGDGFGNSALHWASSLGYARIAKVLIDGKYDGKGADVDLRTTGGGGLTPLMAAVVRGREELVSLLLEGGADVALRRRDGRTALQLAEHKPASLRLLLEIEEAAPSL
jgi:hypothetical protein